MYVGKDGTSQADERMFRKFRDQHGRQWGADCEKRTQHPCGPLSLRGFPVKHVKLKTPAKYFKITDTAAGEITIDYDRWEVELLTAHTEYDLHALEQATALYGDKGPQAIKDRDPALMRRIGTPPERVERVRAAKAGNRWVLGLPNPATGEAEAKPKWADVYFPAPVAVQLQSFPNADEEFPDAANEDAVPTVFPARKVANYYWLSRDHFDAVNAGTEKLFRGTEEQAADAAKLRAGEEPVGAGAHESWGS